jgi:hypothetical protein
LIVKEKLITEILSMEWEMFRNVASEGGESDCQREQKTFVIMRLSQAMSWNEQMLESYLGDLRCARDEGRNLMTEKYARMMKYTHPQEYVLLAYRLPTVSSEKEELAGRITAMMVNWAIELGRKYPHVIGTGRVIERSGDSAYETSLETYCKGELLTYGLRTLQLSLDHYTKCMADGVNSYEKVLESIVKMYGYGSIGQAEADRSAVRTK